MKSITKRMISLLAVLSVISMLLVMVVGCGDKPADPSDPDTSAVSTDPTSSNPEDPTDPADPGETTETGESGETTETGEPSGTATGTEGQKVGTTKSGGLIKTKTTAKKTTEKVTTRTTAKEGSAEDIFTKIPKNLSKTKKIKVLVWWDVAKDSDDMQKAEFFEKKTGYKATYETASLANYQTRLASMVMSGAAPHSAAIINEWYPQPITRGLMQPLDATGWKFTDDIYATALMDQFSYKGKYYGMALKGSYMTTFYVLFFNKKIFQQKGITETPDKLWKAGNWNWDTCLDLAKKTTDASKNLAGMTITYQNYWMLSAGQDFVLSDKNGLVNNIKSADLLKSWEWSWDMIKTYKVVDTSFTDVKPFYSGNAAMFAGGSFSMQAARVPANMKDDWGVVPFPSPKGMAPVAACEGTTFGFPTRIKGDELQKAAWYIRYYLDDAHYGSSTIYTKNECYEVMDWMWKQKKIQSFNSVGVLSYGGNYTAASVQYSLIDQADSKAKLKANLDSWYSVFDANIKSIQSEMG